MRNCLLWGLMIAVVFCLSSCNKQKEMTNSNQITLALNWLPEAEHGGYYAAQLNGDYAAEGLDVKILPGGHDSHVIQRLGTQQVTFGIANADRVALGRFQEARIVAVMAPLQHSPRCIMVHEESGIDSFDKLKNVTLAMSDAPAFSYYLKHHLDLEGVRVVRYTGSLAMFLRDKRYAQQGYVFSEPIIARREGAKVRTLMVSDLGFDPYTSLLLTHENQISKNPELVQKFVRASIKGWQRYFDNPAPVHEHLHKLNPEMTIEVLDEGFAQLKKLSLGDSSTFTGEMQPERWSQLVQQLEEIELLAPEAVSAETLYTRRFLKSTPVDDQEPVE